MGTELSLRIWTASLRFERRLRILAQRVGVHMNSFEVVAWADDPTVRDLPVRGNLNPVSLSMHQVFVHSGKYKVRWKRCGFEKRRCRFRCFLVGVAVVKGRDVNREAVENRRPVSRLVSNQIFVLEIGIADQTY